MNFALVFVKHNQFCREARLTCPLYRSTEDTCIGIYESLCEPRWKKSVSMQHSFEEFSEKQRRVELKSIGNFVAEAVLVESANKFLLEELRKTAWNNFRSHIDHKTQLKKP